MYKFVAYSPNAQGQFSNRITSVYADNERDAKREVERALDRPGRRYLLVEWRAGGQYVSKGGH
jgi:hypothetical protein